MNYFYRVRIDTVLSGTIPVSVYGLEALAPNGTQVLQSIPDVFFHREQAELLARLCTAGGLAPEHLKNVLEDALCRLYTCI